MRKDEEFKRMHSQPKIKQRSTTQALISFDTLTVHYSDELAKVTCHTDCMLIMSSETFKEDKTRQGYYTYLTLTSLQ